ncbi:MAG TPA: O-methyltransferase [Bacteroidota bacterium]|nr:O-methyltransferase [Bacteroidota bacterium]
MNITQPELNDYLLNIIPVRDPVLQDMETYAQKNNFPIIGPLVGRILYSYAKAIDAKRILELGSGYGYSAVWFAKAMGKEGKIICTEGSADNAHRAEEYFKKAKLSTKIDFRVGNALSIIDQVDGEFDIILNDIDKHQYPQAYRKAIPRLRKGGLFITDNVLWSGKVLDKKPDAATAGILTFTRLIYSSRSLFTVILPIRDGVSVSVKL